MSVFFNDQYLQQFNSFVTQLKDIFINNNIEDDDIEINVEDELKIIENLEDNEKLNRGLKFNQLLTDELFDLFLKSRIKVFSHKTETTLELSECLFGKKLTIRNLLNNQSDDIKKIIWKNLYILYNLSEFLKPYESQNSDRITLLNKEININRDNHNTENEFVFNKQDTKNKLQELLGFDVNNQTSGMIDDIVTSFENVLSNDNSNPFLGIMEISQKISSKYSEKINQGDIELDKIMESIMNKIPGMNQIVSSLIKKPDNRNQKIIMDNDFSTANVTVGELENNQSNMNLSNILKMADNFGVLPGSKTENETLPNMNLPNMNLPNMNLPNMDLPDNMFKIFDGLLKSDTSSQGAASMNHLTKMMNIIKKLEKSKSKDDISDIKDEMDTFLGKELGIDVSKLNEDIKKMI
jgi:hypothetical protein